MDQGTQRLIRRHNAQMRHLIVRDIDALEHKLNVKRQVNDMADSAVDTVKGKLGMNDRNPNEGWLGFVRHNAAPLAAVGLGGAVLARNLQSRLGHADTPTGTRTEGTTLEPTTTESSGLRDRASSKLSDASETAADGMDSAREQVAGTTQAVGEKAARAKDSVAEQIPSRSQAKAMARDHSQIMGAGALAAGAVAGVLAPRTKAEERRLPPVQSQMRERAGELADQGMEKAQEKADQAAEAISAGVETAKEEFKDSSDEEPGARSDELAGDTDLPDVTRTNRITGSRTETSGGVTGRTP